MLQYVYASLAAYVASFALGIAGLHAASAAAGVASVVFSGLALARAYAWLQALRDAFWERISGVWLGGEYVAAIWLYVISGVGVHAVGAVLTDLLRSMAFQPVGFQPVGQDLTRLVGVVALVLGLLALVGVGLVAWAYLIEVFTRDLYLIRAVAGVGAFKPSSATFYIVLSLVTTGFLYYYWLYQVWRWISQMRSSTALPTSSPGPVAQ
ncbi:hypothetical protein [Pyrobaculum neutrophilum]|nr:hypothetical protein [Pyrobaculum neutrophilum]